MIERFFLDGVNVLTDNPTIDPRIKFPAAVFTDPANPALSLPNPAFMPAEVADQIPVRLSFVKQGFLNCFHRRRTTPRYTSWH